MDIAKNASTILFKTNRMYVCIILCIGTIKKYMVGIQGIGKGMVIINGMKFSTRGYNNITRNTHWLPTQRLSG
jgi:hypothetical protein